MILHRYFRKNLCFYVQYMCDLQILCPTMGTFLTWLARLSLIRRPWVPNMTTELPLAALWGRDSPVWLNCLQHIRCSFYFQIDKKTIYVSMKQEQRKMNRDIL